MELRPPIISQFSIFGLNGYKDISLSSSNNVKIVVSENGSGKTTLLNTLYSLLSGDLQLFLHADFDRAELTVKGQSFKVIRENFSPINKKILDDIEKRVPWDHFNLTIPSKTELEEMALLLSSKDADIKRSRYIAGMNNEVFYLEDFVKSSVLAALGNVKDKSVDRVKASFASLHNRIRDAVGDARILYLPTYRRIERNLPEFSLNKKTDGFRHNPLNWDDKQLIHFGLQDVEKQLRSRADRIRKTTVEAFSKISGQALDGLLDRDESLIPEIEPDADIESIKVILGRLGGDTLRRSARISGMFESGEINRPEHRYLRRLIAQLLETYASTQDQEEALESFTKLINSYWEDDPEKDIVFDKVSAEVTVVNKYTNNNLRLDALSSGEKQIVSVLARLRLGEGDGHIILIDEPELSLSLEWQRKFLVDVCDSPGFLQLIAITHSPFIFKNDLKVFAGDLKIKRHVRGRHASESSE